MPYANNDGVRIHYHLDGKADSPPLVLHIGFMGRLQDWDREDVGIARALRADYRLIALDPRGQGASDKPHESAAYTLDRQVGDVLAVLDATGVDQAHFWGYSMGGWIGFGLG